MKTNFIQAQIIKLLFEVLKQYYKAIRLDEILNLSNGKSMTKANMNIDGSIPVYGANGFIGLTNKALVLERTITIGRVGSCGEVNITSGKAWISDNAMWVSTISQSIDLDYLYFALKSLPLAEAAKIAAMPSISQTNVLRESIPLPPINEQLQVAAFLKDFCQNKPIDICANLPSFLTEQRRIVVRIEEFVGKIEEVRSLRQQTLDETEALKLSSAKAIFEELAQAGTQPLHKVVTVQGGGTPSKQNPFFWDGSIPWISPKDMKNREIYNSIDHISEEATLKSSAKLLQPGSVLIVVRGMILAHTVPSAVLQVPAAINQDMKALFPSQEITPEFLCCVLWGLNDSLLELVEKSTHDTRKLETPKLLNFQIPVPPLSEQNSIVAYINKLQSKVDTIKRFRAAAIKELDALLPSILDKAFKGEL